MTDTAGAPPSTGRVSPTGILSVVLGLALFVYVVREAGVTEIREGIARVGWGFTAIVALSGYRFAVRALAWTRCVKGAGRLTFRDAIQATVAGDALGNITPLGLIISEPAKVLLVTSDTRSQALAGLAVENLFYTLSVAVMFAVGLVALFVRFDAPLAWWLVAGAALSVLVLVLLFAHGVLWRRVRIAGGTLDWLGRYVLRSRWLDNWLSQLRAIETRMHELYPRSRTGLVPLALLHVSFHAAAVAEVYVTLALINGRAPTVLDALLLESANRFITVVFKFIPLRVGVDEAGTGAFAELLQVGTTTGVALAIVRKARMVFWLIVGIGNLTRRGLSVRAVLRHKDRYVGGMTGGLESPAARATNLRTSASADTVVAIMARSPRDEMASIKTRLAVAVPDARDRLDLYTAFIADEVARCRGLAGTALRVAHTPEGGPSGFAELGIAGDELMAQRGHGLGERERHLFEDLFGAGYRKAIIIGSDLPTLPEGLLREAIDRLDNPNTVVLGPSEDGGYYLLGLMAPLSAAALPDLFTNIRWSTASALDDTVAAADRCGVLVQNVAAWYDVDDESGLARLRHDLADPAHATRAPATAAALKRIFAKAN